MVVVALLALSAVVVGCSSEDASCVLGSEGCACNLGKCLTAAQTGPLFWLWPESRIARH